MSKRGQRLEWTKAQNYRYARSEGLTVAQAKEYANTRMPRRAHEKTPAPTHAQNIAPDIGK